LLLLVVSGALCGACGDQRGPIEEPAGLSLVLQASADEIEFGEAFEVTIRRTWPSRWQPLPLHSEALQPLIVELVERVRDDDNERVQETARYLARVFARGEVVVPGPVFSVRDHDSTVRRVQGNELRLQLRTSLVSGAAGGAGNPEFPELLQVPGASPWWLWIGSAAVVAALVAMFLRLRRPVEHSVSVVGSGPSPSERALQRLRGLAGQQPADWPAIQTFYVEVTATVREFLAAGRVRRSREMTTEELLAVCPGDRLDRCLRHCDLVKFAHVEPTDDQRAAAVDDAMAFVRAQGAP